MSEVDLTTEPPLRVTIAARWPKSRPGRRPLAAPSGAAILLHVAVCAAILTIVHPQVPPAALDDQAVEVVFASQPAVTPESPAQAELEAPAALPAEAETPKSQDIPLPPDTPAEVQLPPPLPKPSPIPSVETLKPSVPVPQEARPARVPKAIPQAKTTPAARPAEAPATNPAPPTAFPPSARQMTENPISGDWQRSVATWLAGRKTYPELARRRGIEGIAALRFTADRTGHVLTVELVRSAGAVVLDDAAEAILRNATLPPFPPDMSQDKITVTVQIRYTLAK